MHYVSDNLKSMQLDYLYDPSCFPVDTPHPHLRSPSQACVCFLPCTSHDAKDFLRLLQCSKCGTLWITTDQSPRGVHPQWHWIIYVVKNNSEDVNLHKIQSLQKTLLFLCHLKKPTVKLKGSVQCGYLKHEKISAEYQWQDVSNGFH